MGAMRLEDYPEVKDRVSIVAAKNKKGKVELKNKTGKVAVVNPDLCIGCGVCAYKCSTQSLVLERRETIQDTPKNAPEYVMRVTADFAAARAQIKQRRNK